MVPSPDWRLMPVRNGAPLDPSSNPPHPNLSWRWPPASMVPGLRVQTTGPPFSEYASTVTRPGTGEL